LTTSEGPSRTLLRGWRCGGSRRWREPSYAARRGTLTAVKLAVSKPREPEARSLRDLLFRDWAERAAARSRSLFVPTVASVAVTDLIGLSNADDAVKQLYDWERDRLFTLAKGLGAAAVGVVTTLLVDAVENKSTDNRAVWGAAAFAVMLLLWAGFILTGLRRLAEEYPVAMKLLNGNRL
jgi:uncharacterized membrane protein YjfL (UPF0719 family)